MPKTIPACPEKPAKPPRVPLRYQVEVVTPMVGGGVVAGVPDEHLPIRPTAIRGHLRSWWREVIGRTLPSDAARWRREEELFGSTEFPSPLQVRVHGVMFTELIDAKSSFDRFSPRAYAVFASIENELPVAREGIQFGLELRLPSETELRVLRQAQNDRRKKANKDPLPPVIPSPLDEIRACVRAWVRFGGIGGRTRRGCGALFSTDIDASTVPTDANFQLYLGPRTANAVDAWGEAVRVYRDFRQSPRGKPHKKKIPSRPDPITVPGRSHWPEADSIRHITGCALKPAAGTPPSEVPVDIDTNDHSVPLVLPALLPSFPRAALGLPINFYFADSPGKKRPGAKDKDPQDVQLVPLVPGPGGTHRREERMASPVVTRPLWVDGAWYPAVIILDRLLPPGFAVRLEGDMSMAGGGKVSRDVPMRGIADPSLGVLKPLRGQPDALIALTHHLIADLKWRRL